MPPRVRPEVVEGPIAGYVPTLVECVLPPPNDGTVTSPAVSLPLSRRSRLLLGVLFEFVVGVPIVGLSGELVLRLQWASAQRVETAFRHQNPNAFGPKAVREAADLSLWKIQWRQYRPGARLDTTIGGERFVVEINSLGFRTREFSPAKPPGTIRVACIGASTTVQGRTNQETYPAILEKRLRETHPTHTIEVLNLGVSGVSSKHWLERAAELFSYEPDVVVQYEAVNDIMWGALPRFAATHPWRRRLHTSLLLERLFPIGPHELDPDLSQIVENQARLARLCLEHHVHHLAGSFAAPDYALASPDVRNHLDINTSEWTGGRGSIRLSRYAGYARILSRYDELFQEAASSQRLEGVMVGRTLRDPGLFVDLCHMNQEGISRLAEAFLPAVGAAVEGATPVARESRAPGPKRPSS